MCRRKAGEWINRKRARNDRKGERYRYFYWDTQRKSLRRRKRRGGGGGGWVWVRATVSIDLVSDYRFISRCLLDVITQFDVAEIAREHQRKG